MTFKRIIPCLDFFENRIVKGVNFKNLKDIGDALDVAKFYGDEGADEIIFLDISANIDNRNHRYKIFSKISASMSIPLTIGGGVKNINDFKNLFNSGADKVAINSYIINDPGIINNLKNKYGSQCIVAALDIKKYFYNKKLYFWNVYKNSGKLKILYNFFDLILKFYNLGIGELLLTSIDNDGTKKGFDIEILSKISKIINISIIASGGGGNLNNISDALKVKNINSVLLASVLHNKIYNIYSIKNFLINNGIFVKI